MKFKFSRQFFEIYSAIKFHENPSSGSPSCSLRTDTTKLIHTFRNFANASNKRVINAERVDYCNGSGTQQHVVVPFKDET